MLKKILFSLVLGIIAALYFAQNDSWVHDAVGRKIKIALESAWNCRLEFEIEHVNIFVPSVTLKNIVCFPKRPMISSAEPLWHWKAHYATLSTSWLTFGLSSMIGLHIILDGVQAYTKAHTNYIPLVHDHVVKMIYGMSCDVPIYVQSLAFNRSTLHVHHEQTNAVCVAEWSSVSKNSDGAFKTKIYMHDGDVRIADKAILKHIKGDVHIAFAATPLGLKNDCLIDCSLDIPLANKDVVPCYATGQWHSHYGDFSIKSIDETMYMAPIHMALDGHGLIIDAQIQAPLRAIASIFTDGTWHQQLDGIGTIHLHSEHHAHEQKIKGECTTGTVDYGAIQLCDAARATFDYSSDTWQGDISLDYAPIGAFKGSWMWNNANATAFMKLDNAQMIKIPGFSKWLVEKEKISLQAEVLPNTNLACSYHATATNTLTHDTIQVNGKIIWDHGILNCMGNLNQSLYDCSFAFDPSITLKKLTYKNSQGIVLLDLHQSKPASTEFNGVVDIAFLRLVGQQFLQYSFQGEGQLAVNGRVESDCLHIDTHLKNGIIRLPKTYNFINEFTAHIVCDATHKNISVDALRCGLHRGVITCPRIIFQADNAYALQYAYAPFIFESCLLNVKKDLFALFSGTLAISKDHDKLAHAQGSFIIERSYVKENLYSQAFQKNIAGFTSLIVDTDKQDMSCDITVETKEPLRVDTAFLEASAKIALHITNTVRNPKISGSIDLLSGSLAFPYKPLLISKGSIYFMPDQLFDPLIELVAKNKIKKYNISLQVTGSLLNHDISLESTPPLTDEQIIALLLVGSQEQSLNIVMPALLMQNLKSVLFDSEQSPLRLNEFFKSWLKPFKGINIVPSFSDQTGRGGLRGAIEIEINDRWRAMAQKNFSLSEDTRFEVEYLLSDDVTIRGIRNERKDVAGEVEMRWKFGK